MGRVLAAPAVTPYGSDSRAKAGWSPEPLLLGRSREGRPLHGYRMGRGAIRVSLLAGCHADEPVGPRLLRRLVSALAALPQAHPLVSRLEWWIVPHANPDGERRNRAWQAPGRDAFDLPWFLRHRVRELPGDDMEFGFPRGPEDQGARPENQAIHEWWRTAPGAFLLHVSLHGMAFGAGPWFLVEPAWTERTSTFRSDLAARVRAMGYRLHDVEREGEKGFHRIEPGFATRPDSQAMKRHFLEQDDEETAGRFRPSSMEEIRSLAAAFGADPLTLVTEVPLFVTPGVGRELGPPDPAVRKWSARIAGWDAELTEGAPPERIRKKAAQEGLYAVPIRDQMELQWACICRGLDVVAPRSEGDGSALGDGSAESREGASQ